MQTEVYPNGDVVNRFIQARNEEDLQQRLKDEYQRANRLNSGRSTTCIPSF